LHVVKHENVTGLHASPPAHSAPPFAGAQQVEAEAPQQTPFSHFSPSAQFPRPVPVHASPSPTMATHAPAAQPYPLWQSPSPEQWSGHVATGWSLSAAHTTASKTPQSRASALQPLSSGTVTDPQTESWHVASRRVPWHSVVGPLTAQAGAER
jgi:hypothetical protein